MRPRQAPAGRQDDRFRFRLLADLPLCRQGATIRFAGHRAKTNAKGVARLKVKPARPQARRPGRPRRSAEPARAKVRVKPGLAPA